MNHFDAWSREMGLKTLEQNTIQRHEDEIIGAVEKLVARMQPPRARKKRDLLVEMILWLPPIIPAAAILTIVFWAVTRH